MFSDDFKAEVFKVCLPAGQARKAIRAFEKNNHVMLRHLLEDLLDDFQLYEDGNVGSNRKVKAEKKHTHEARLRVYSDLMEIITKNLDNGKLLPEYRVYI